VLLLPLIVGLSMQAKLQVDLDIHGATPEEQTRLDSYGRLAKAKVEEAFPKILKILDYQGRSKTTVIIHVSSYLHPHDNKLAWTNTWWDPYTVKGDICVPSVMADPGDIGMIVHELMHVIQVGYKSSPGWLVEGTADYVRYYFFDPPSRRPRAGKGSDCHDSYGITAQFLDWAAHRYAPNLLRALDLGFRTGQSPEEIFQTATKRSLTQLNEEWKRELQR
jgi:hypothetical protein